MILLMNTAQIGISEFSVIENILSNTKTAVRVHITCLSATLNLASECLYMNLLLNYDGIIKSKIADKGSRTVQRQRNDCQYLLLLVIRGLINSLYWTEASMVQEPSIVENIEALYKAQIGRLKERYEAEISHLQAKMQARTNTLKRENKRLSQEDMHLEHENRELKGQSIGQDLQQKVGIFNLMGWQPKKGTMIDRTNVLDRLLDDAERQKFLKEKPKRTTIRQELSKSRRSKSTDVRKKS